MPPAYLRLPLGKKNVPHPQGRLGGQTVRKQVQKPLEAHQGEWATHCSKALVQSRNVDSTEDHGKERRPTGMNRGRQPHGVVAVAGGTASHAVSTAENLHT